MKLTMKERPILFNGEMVRAILEGRKTQTRRPVKQWAEDGDVDAYGRMYFTGMVPKYPCPYGKPGDHLWVRETWKANGTMGGPRITYCADGGEAFPAVPDSSPCWIADDHCWRPSIHMPRWASRLLLEITAVRVERVADISEADAKAEGVRGHLVGSGDSRLGTQTVYGLGNSSDCSPTAKGGFAEIWSAAYPGSWERNDWVWVIEFRRVEA